MAAILKMSNPLQFFVNLIVFSFVPAFCEEFFFRGTMQPIWTKYFKRNWLAIITTAFIFSFLHFQFSGFLPRFLAGIVIGGIYYYTASLWLCFLCHAFYNGTLVVLNYTAQHNLIKETVVENIILNPVLLLCAAPAILFLFYQLRKNFLVKGGS